MIALNKVNLLPKGGYLVKENGIKKLTSIMLCFLLCILVAIPAGASNSKPAVEIMNMSLSRNSVGGISIDLDYRNNSGRTIKYIEWHATAYNRVGDPVLDDIRGKSTVTLRVTGPVEPFSFVVDPTEQVYHNEKADGTPFSEYRYTYYSINNGYDDWSFVYLDKYGNLYAEKDISSDRYVYLTEDEIQNAMYHDSAYFKNAFYGQTIDHINIDYAVVTYMDNTTEKVTNPTSKYYGQSLQNQPFLSTVARYAAVYNYQDYITLNPDLVSVLGNNEKLLFEHFINNGMKEGRQGSMEFNLAAYKANNPDLVASFGDDNVKYYEHFISFGKAEGRKAV